MARTSKKPAPGRSVVRTARFTAKQWDEIEERSKQLRMPPARFMAYAAIRACELPLPELAGAAEVTALLQGA
jgi:hypothetical protein